MRRILVLFGVPMMVGLAMVVVACVFLAAALGAGWVISRLLPFDLFQGTVLGAVSLAGGAISVVAVLYRLMFWAPPRLVEIEEDEDEDDEDEDEDEDEAPIGRPILILNPDRVVRDIAAQRNAGQPGPEGHRGGRRRRKGRGRR